MNQLHKRVKILPYQRAFLSSKTKYTFFIGSIGVGKTYIGCIRLLQRCINNPEGTHVITANSYKQLLTGTLTTLFGILDEWQIDYEFKKHSMEIHTLGTVILAFSMDAYQKLRSTEISSALLDEARDYDEEAFQVLCGRLRNKKTKSFHIDVVSSPNGFNNWLYDYTYGSKKLEELTIVRAKTKENIFLPPHYLETLARQYDDLYRKQELEGEFVNLTSGQVYRAFSREKHAQTNVAPPDSASAIRICLDFNVSPMCSAAYYIKNNKIYVFDETCKKDTNTFEMAEQLWKKYSQFPNALLIPDSTGNSRRSSSTKTDHQILTEKGFFIPPVRNPLVRDRVNCVNGLFSHDRIIIDPKCVNLIADLEKLAWDNCDVFLSHISDAFGYGCWFDFPLEAPQKPSRTINI